MSVFAEMFLSLPAGVLVAGLVFLVLDAACAITNARRRRRAFNLAMRRHHEAMAAQRRARNRAWDELDRLAHPHTTGRGAQR